MKQSIIFLSLLMNFLALTGQPLSMHQWKDRLILLFSPDYKNSPALEQMERFQLVEAALQERDLLIYRISSEGVKGPDEKLETTAAWFYKNYRVGKDEFTIILIGKDGGEKLRSEELIVPEKIFELIDTMPMRRAEMRRKEGGK